MAFAALKRQVFPLQRIPRLAVVKIHGTDQTPALAIVTGVAVYSQFTFVCVSVTVTALSKRYPDELLVVRIVRKRAIIHEWVTLRADNRLMLPCQSESGHSVIETRRRHPGGLTVTFRADVAQLAAMFIAMASGARRPKSEIRATRVDLLFRSDHVRSDVFWRVALAAGQRPMFFLKPKAGEEMVKGGFTVFPVDQRDLASLVLHMALLASLVFGSAVQALAGSALILNASMAGQTFFWHQFLIATVTIGAVRDPLEKSVRLVEIARRELRPGSSCCEHHGDYCEYSSHRTHP
jgi:hypothetical protein